MEVAVARGGRTGRVGDFRLRVLDAPGLAVPTPGFTVLNDLTKYAPWISDLQGESDQTGFAEQQTQASSKLLDALCTLAPAALAYGSPLDGLAYGYGYGGYGYAANSYLRQQLEPLTPDSVAPDTMPDRVTTAASWLDPLVSTALLVRPRVREIVAKWALELVCQAQVGRESKNDWWALAAFFGSDGDALFRSCRFEVDLSNPRTGRASLVIDGGSGSLR